MTKKKSSQTSSSTSSDKPTVDIQLPFTSIQQAILARKTRAVDLQTEFQLRQLVLNLSCDLDQLDQDYFKSIYLKVRQECPGAYDFLVQQPDYGQIDFQVSPVDMSLNHLQLMESVLMRGDGQRVLFLQYLQQLLNCYLAMHVTDAERVTMLIHDLSKQQTWLHDDQIAKQKQQTVHHYTRQIAQSKRASKVKGNQYPPLDMFQTGDNFVIRCYVPGIAQDQVFLDVSNEDNAVVISGQDPKMDVDWVIKETPTTHFKRQVTFDVKVNLDSVSTKFEDGVLEVTIPKQKD
ncbi:HSP20-like chaperone [Gorgonomyces haynaldii]|nr:HSP20-like chaperone [Gorgonomyces haynaldii]